MEQVKSYFDVYSSIETERESMMRTEYSNVSTAKINLRTCFNFGNICYTDDKQRSSFNSSLNSLNCCVPTAITLTTNNI